MAATVGIAGVGTFGPMLKEFYQGPVAEQINNRVWMTEYFKKYTKGWTGKQLVMPIHIGRNSGVGYQGEAPGALPTAGQQQYRDLRVNAHSSYGRFQVSGLAMDTASSAGAGAFAGVMNEEMDRLVRDISNNENAINIFGGPTKGLLNERKANGQDTTDSQTVAGAGFSTPVVWQYQGDFSYFDGSRTGVAVNQADNSTWVRVELVDLNTYDLIPVTENATGAPAINPNIFVSAFSADRTNPTVSLTIGVNNGGAVPCSFTTENVGGQCAIALRLHGTQAVDSAGPPGVALGQNPARWGNADLTSAESLLGAQNVVANQSIGLFENLASQVHFGVDRNDTAATGANFDQRILKSTIVTHDVGDGDRGNAGADLSLERLQYMMDIMMQDAGVDPDVMVMNALMRHRYTVQLTGILGTTAGEGANSNITVDGSGGKLMDNQQNLAYGGVKFQYDRHFPVSTIALLHSKDWCLAELSSGQFADEDGNILFRVAGQDAYEGFWKHRYNIVCKRPNAQVILTGITPT
tara:strand:- start:736 stop:2301 length:1566 start_codon:yes stop_codon:yes gene_type:complete